MKKNETVKGLQSYLNKEAKRQKKLGNIELATELDTEYSMAFWTPGGEGPKDRKLKRHAYTQAEFKKYFDRFGDTSGATKAVHLFNKCHVNENNEVVSNDNEKTVAFEKIVIKRIKHGAWIPNMRRERARGTGNQGHDEAACWNKYADTEFADFLCPILRCLETKSDNNYPTTEKALDNFVSIMQRAETVCALKRACIVAVEKNIEAGIPNFEPWEERANKMLEFAAINNWRDVERNPGNSGVIFDYSQQRYKAVFIDYAL